MSPDLNTICFYILIVDDDTDDHFFLRQAISNVVPQALIDSVYDGDEALDYLNSCTSMPNLIFLDLNMRKMSGRDTMKVIKANEMLKNVPVIILTTSHNEKEKKEMLSLGAAAFYTKPGHSKDLVGIVEDVSGKWLI
jgi:two-component system, response regulator